MEAGNLWKSTVELPMTLTDLTTNVLSRVVNVPGNVLSYIPDKFGKDNIISKILKYPGRKAEQILRVGGHIAKSIYYIPAGFIEKIPTGLNLASGDVFAPFSETWSRTLEVAKATPNTALEMAKIVPTVDFISGKIAYVLGWGKDKTSGMLSGINTEPFDAKPKFKYSWQE